MFVLLRFTFAPQGGHMRIRSKLLVCAWNQQSFRRPCSCYSICSATLPHLLVTFYFHCIIHQYLFNEIVFFLPLLILVLFNPERNFLVSYFPIKLLLSLSFFPQNDILFLARRIFTPSLHFPIRYLGDDP